MGLLLVLIFFLSLIRGNKNFVSLINLSNCGVGYWIVTLIIFGIS